MPPPRVSSAASTEPQQTAEQVADLLRSYIEAHPNAAVLEDGRVLFDLSSAHHEISTTHDRCSLQLWSDDQNLTRRVLSVMERNGTLRLATQRFGHSQSKLLELVPSRVTRTPTTRDSARTRYPRLLERILLRSFPDYKAGSFHTAMDLEESFGPAYARGSLTRGNQAIAVIGANEGESATTIDDILTTGILWLHRCRERAAGKQLYQGLKIIVPRGTAQLTLARVVWLNHDAAEWKVYELDAANEELIERDPADQGNVRARLIHRPDDAAARERFQQAADDVRLLVPEDQWERVEQRLRSAGELAFLLHGLEFARARIATATDSFAHSIALSVGAAPEDVVPTAANRDELREKLAELFNRRRAFVPARDFGRRAYTQRIGSSVHTRGAHSRLNIATPPPEAYANPTQDPLYRAAPERWLESVLRANLAPLTRSAASTDALAIPRLDPEHVYSQVPAIAGASDHGILDLLGVTADGRLAVIELKAAEDLHFALQGLDYWIRVRHHHLQPAGAAERRGFEHRGELQRHGYFRGVELSPQPPRLYLVAPALHIHPATETILRYVSPQVEWHLLALDERWRQSIRVVWRRQHGWADRRD
jgi:hypothetical protein